MKRSLSPIAALFLVASSAWAVSLAELQQRHKPLPTVPEAQLPPLKNKPEPFPGTVRHPGFEAHTWVKFPFVENPGSFGFDRKGRLFVAETNRFWQGVPDLRGANELIREDFQSVKVEDRAKLYEKWAARFPPGFFTNTADRLIRLEDRDGNGAADHRTLFSDRFYEALDGIGFSVLAEDDAVYFTCIPNVWKLTDKNDDGVADAEEAIATGFGVRVSFIGHDLHGITRGPDGRLYFSVGDRGYHVTGVDPSESGISFARSAPSNAVFEVGSAYENLQDRFGRFRGVISLEVVEHLYSPREFAANLFGLVEPGGVAIVSTPFHGYWKNLSLAVSGKLDDHFNALWDHGHIKFWSVKTLTELLEESGFSDVQFRYAGRIYPLSKSMIAIARRPETGRIE